MNLPVCHTISELTDRLREKLDQWENTARNFQPEVVRDGPVLKNVDSGNDVDLTKFPVPKYHEQDGGRYVGTGHTLITRDPDTGQINSARTACSYTTNGLPASSWSPADTPDYTSKSTTTAARLAP